MSIQTNKAIIDENGNLQEWSNAQPIGMTCEHGNCNSTNGRDYKRKNEKGPWADEPIFLCENHSKGYDNF